MHVSFIKFPEDIEEQKEWIRTKAIERLEQCKPPITTVCTDALYKYTVKKDFKELIEVVNSVVMDTFYYEGF